MSATPSNAKLLFVWSLCVAVVLSNPTLDSFIYELVRKPDSANVPELFADFSDSLGWDVSSLALPVSVPSFSHLRFLCDLILSFLKEKNVMAANVLKSRLVRAFDSGWPALTNCMFHLGHTLMASGHLPGRYMTVFPHESASSPSTPISSLPQAASATSTIKDPVISLDPVSLSLGEKRGYSDLANEEPGTPEHRVKVGVVATPNTGRAEATGVSRAEVELVQHVPFPEFCDVHLEEDDGAHCIQPIIFKLDKVFESLEKFETWVRNDSLLSSVGWSKKSVNRKPFNYYTIFCNSKIPFNGKWSQKYRLTPMKKEPLLPQHKCPWRARGRHRSSDGAFAFYTPVYSPDLFEEARNKFGGFDESTRRLWFEKAKIPQFITECLHVHRADGSGCTHVPGGLLAIAEDLYRKSRHDFNFNHLNFENTIKAHPDFRDFHGVFQKILRLVSQRSRSPPPRTPHELIDWVRQKLGGKRIGLAVNEIPDDDNTPVILMDFDGQGEAYFLVTRGSLLKQGRKSLVFHCDATFKVINKSDLKLLGVSFQDAKQKPFPAGFMLAASECKRSYDAMFQLLKKGFDLARNSILPQHEETEPVCHVKHVMYDGLNYGHDEVKKYFGENCMRSTCYFHVLNCLHKHGKIQLKLDDGVLKVIKATVTFISTAPSAFSMVSLWSIFKEALPLIFPHEGALPAMIKMMSSSYMNFSRKNDFIWFSSAVHRKSLTDPHGPVSCRSNNPIESIWAWFKRDLRALSPGQKPRDSREMVVFLAEVMANIDSNFCEQYNVLKEDFNLKLVAMLQKHLIQSALQGTDGPFPDVNDRFFVLMRDTRELIPLTEEGARTLIGEFIDDRGAYISLSPAEFESQVDQIDKFDLLAIMQRGYIIQFRADALPGTRDSFALGTCTCRSSTVKTYCAHLLGVHYLMHPRRRELHPESVDPNELGDWPTWSAFLSAFGLPADLPSNVMIEAEPENLMSSEADMLAVDEVTLETVDDLVQTVLYEDKEAESTATAIKPRRVVDTESFKRSLRDESKGWKNLFKNGIISPIARESKESKRGYRARSSEYAVKQFLSFMDSFCELARIPRVMSQENVEKIKPLLERAREILIR